MNRPVRTLLYEFFVLPCLQLVQQSLDAILQMKRRLQPVPIRKHPGSGTDV
jgi:hypothetical protein